MASCGTYSQCTASGCTARLDLKAKFDEGGFDKLHEQFAEAGWTHHPVPGVGSLCPEHRLIPADPLTGIPSLAVMAILDPLIKRGWRGAHMGEVIPSPEHDRATATMILLFGGNARLEWTSRPFTTRPAQDADGRAVLMNAEPILFSQDACVINCLGFYHRGSITACLGELVAYLRGDLHRLIMLSIYPDGSGWTPDSNLLFR